ncbi:hypothetical protein KIN20_032331 [Parelaphostrongylus tenuis]|uniref:Uncharacterized protein n=1 Tax=Parelaphostrongylus tenuis TaxID=148309 RepID=A0AAD5WHG1_PARTN|nr:hypothetical protein KIN20_032331 [Parelaphostrongylus tenuis]
MQQSIAEVQSLRFVLYIGDGRPDRRDTAPMPPHPHGFCREEIDASLTSQAAWIRWSRGGKRDGSVLVQSVRT